jgi:hypothetical protein
VLVDDRVDQQVVHVFVRDEHRVGPGQRLPLGEHTGVDDQHAGVGFEAHAGVPVLDQSH